MGSLGVHFALTSEQAQALLGADDPDDLLTLLEEIEEELADEADQVASDKAWDAIHRCLSDGTLDPTAGTYPLSYAVLGGTRLDAGDDYFVSFRTTEQVGDVARALAPLDEQAFRERFFTLNPDDYDGARDEDDFAYTWSNLIDIRTFFTRAAQLGRPVIFTVDQ
ncbi:YfbM family protein [Nocardia brasiliensis]|uniref:YfbM family protein n=1 Tax=Nocardia brasiliensis TaxID=37326 RepID=UPI00245440A3|nr:YfbM family protein [Nocardia brasiliensis]